MNITYIPQRIELVFWSAAIPLMTESPLVGKAIKCVYTVFHIARSVPPLAWLALSATSGLGIGLGLALLKLVIYP
jgi:ABC-type proline/glycine betaine transport system permease subunit